MRMMIPKKRELSGTVLLYIVVPDFVGLTNVRAHPRALTIRAAPVGGSAC